MVSRGTVNHSGISLYKHGVKIGYFALLVYTVKFGFVQKMGNGRF